MTTHQEIAIKQWSEGIAMVQLNRPRKKNALTLDNMRDIAKGRSDLTNGTLQ